MIEKEVIVKSQDGIGIKKAANFSVIATNFRCHVTLIKGNAEIDGKSILGVISLALIKGDKVNIKTEGIDEKECIERLSTLFT